MDLTSDCSEALEIKITEILREIGVPAHIKGYYYLRHAISYTVKNCDILTNITKKLYPDVAKKFNTTTIRVERAIRHAIEVAWNRGNINVLDAYFGCATRNLKGKPTNGEFIATISDSIKIHMKVQKHKKEVEQTTFHL